VRVLNAAALALLVAAAARSVVACEVDTRPLEFGIVEPVRGASARGRLTLTCDTPGTFAIGLTSQSDGTARLLAGPGTAHLVYQIFTDGSLSVPWGDNITVGPTVGVVSDGEQAVVLTLYAEIFSGQSGIPPGDYADQLTVTVNF